MWHNSEIKKEEKSAHGMEIQKVDTKWTECDAEKEEEEVQNQIQTERDMRI